MVSAYGYDNSLDGNIKLIGTDAVVWSIIADDTVSMFGTMTFYNIANLVGGVASDVLASRRPRRSPARSAVVAGATGSTTRPTVLQSRSIWPKARPPR